MEWTFTTSVDTEALVESLCENRDFMRQVAGHLNTYDIANELSVSDIADEIGNDLDTYDIARAIDLDDLAQAFDYDDLCEKIAEHMPDNANNDDFRALQQQVNTLTQTVERLMGVLDWSLDHMRKGIVLVDTNQDFTLGTGIEAGTQPHMNEPLTPVEQQIVVDAWTSVPDYL